jgi:hypothetical protein
MHVAFAILLHKVSSLRWQPARVLLWTVIGCFHILWTAIGLWHFLWTCEWHFNLLSTCEWHFSFCEPVKDDYNFLSTCEQTPLGAPLEPALWWVSSLQPTGLACGSISNISDLRVLATQWHACVSRPCQEPLIFTVSTLWGLWAQETTYRQWTWPLCLLRVAVSQRWKCCRSEALIPGVYLRLGGSQPC